SRTPPRLTLFPYTTLFRSFGGADVLALSHDGKGELRRGFVYQDALRVDSVSPGVTGTDGGELLVITGAGFSPLGPVQIDGADARSEEHTSELQSRENLVCR